MEEIEGMKDSKILYITINKRINTKFIRKDGNRFSNPLPGTVLDHSVTKDKAYDFFLVSTQSRQGVPIPSQFSVLKNDVGASPEDIQKLTYQLCYLYYNFNGAVNVPAPIRYAEILASNMLKFGIKPDQLHQHYDTIRGLYFI